ncbi:MAG: sugar ABC transporter permease YjfF [Clostridia bacterium]|nr:sugar ABC transporter permease YjfF [Clostridia bacterium]
MTTANRTLRRKQREPLSDASLLTLIAIGIFVVMYAAAVIFMGGAFQKVQQFLDLFNENAALIIIACALTVVMIGGGINISVGGIIGLTCMACAKFLEYSAPANSTLAVLLTVALALGVGLAFGLFEGFMVSYLEIQPFIVTLAGMFLARGLTTILSVNPVKVTHEGFQALVKTKLQIPWLGYTAKNGNLIPAKLEIGAIIAVAVVAAVWLMLRYTRLGRGIYALGGNRQSALMLGINVKSVCFRGYVISGLLAGLAGLVFLMHKPAANASIAMRSEMDAIAASIIGGTLLTGGVGNVIGTLFGVMILAAIQKIIGLSPLNESWWQDMASGAMLGIFILLQSVILNRRGKGGTKDMQADRG